MIQHFDCVVVGLGAMGSSALYHLSRRGKRVLGIEQFPLGHNLGSSHGRSRVFRSLYLDEYFVELALEAKTMWHELEKLTSQTLLQPSGLLAFASPANVRFAEQHAALERTSGPHPVMDGRDVNQRFDMFSLSNDVVAFHAEQNGVLFAGRCLDTMRRLAKDHGAEIWDSMSVTALDDGSSNVTVQTEQATVTADQVVVTAGPWLSNLLADLQLPLKVAREQKVYFEVADARRFHVDRMPVFVEYDSSVYGLPQHHSPGLKMAMDHSGQHVDPRTVNREVDEDYIATLQRWIDEHLTAAFAKPVESAVCLYTNTPDLDFIMDRHPHRSRVVVAGGFSGHGFKFSVLVGDIMADLVIDGSTDRQIDSFGLGRFSSAQ